MPWSVKAQTLVKDQYASVGAATRAALPEVEKALQMAYDRGIKDAMPFLEKFSAKNKAIAKYVQAYQNYCWPPDLSKLGQRIKFGQVGTSASNSSLMFSYFFFREETSSAMFSLRIPFIWLKPMRSA